MKKVILFPVMLMLAISTAFAVIPKDGGNTILPLSYKPIKLGGQQTPLPKSPVQIPEVWQDGHTLYFDAAIEGCTIQLLDEDENVVFSHFIEENETSLTFPSTLTGTYELQIIRGSIVFYCEIEL